MTLLVCLLLTAVGHASVSSLEFTTVNKRDLSGTHTFTEGVGGIALTHFRYGSGTMDVYRFSFANLDTSKYAILELTLPIGELLALGTYAGASNPYAGRYANILVDLGPGGAVGYASSTTSYTVNSAVYDTAGQLTSLDVSFVQTERFGGFPPAETRGMLRFNPIPEPSGMTTLLLVGFMAVRRRHR